jgi:cytochrome bd-type quinol oxidase subunit 2
MAKQKFDAKSPGFIASVTYVLLAALAATGVEFPSDPQSVAGDFETTLNSGGIFAVVGLLVSSIVFPTWNFIKKGGKISGKVILSNNTFWISVATAALSVALLFGFTVPDGTAEQVVAAVYAKDWGVIFTMIVIPLFNTLIKYFKHKQEQPDTTPAEG